MKRQTVIRMLNKRLSESKRMLKHSIDYNDMVNVMGGNYDEQKENQFKANMQTDIDQLIYIIWCLKNRDAIKEMFGEFGA